MLLPRQTEPELMEEPAQVAAYAGADFSTAHENILKHFTHCFPDLPIRARVADLGCGNADISVRLAQRQPGWQFDALDGSATMLAYGKQLIDRLDLGERIRLRQSVLPVCCLPAAYYDVVVSNSLLHHLHQPEILWDTIKMISKPGTTVFVSDLRRPDSDTELQQLVERYADNAPYELRRDFGRSLHAAFVPAEVVRQLEQADLGGFDVLALGDRHLFAYGRMPS